MTNAQVRDIIETKLKEKGLIKESNTVNYPPRPIDVDSLTFDNEHARKKHEITEEEAKQIIKDAIISITREWDDAEFENYFSKHGAAFVNMDLSEIKTAFGAGDFKGAVNGIMEVLKEYGLLSSVEDGD